MRESVRRIVRWVAGQNNTGAITSAGNILAIAQTKSDLIRRSADIRSDTRYLPVVQHRTSGKVVPEPAALRQTPQIVHNKVVPDVVACWSIVPGTEVLIQSGSKVVSLRTGRTRARAIIQGFGIGISHAKLKSVTEAPSNTSLQTVVVGRKVEYLAVDRTEPRIGPEEVVGKNGAGRCLATAVDSRDVLVCLAQIRLYTERSLIG